MEYRKRKEAEPNNAMEPTPVNVTFPACAGTAPFTSAAILGVRQRMSTEPESFMAGRRDARAERATHRWLRSTSDEVRLQFVRRCLEIGSRDNRAYDLAVSCIARPENAFSIFVQKIASPDASGIKFWLKFAVQKCGAMRTIREIASRLDSEPDTVSMALYWLPGIVPREEERAVSELAKLRAEASGRGIIKGPKTEIAPNGAVLFRKIYGA